MAIRVGRWDCDRCGHKGNLGPKTKCEKCGSPRPLNVKFYLADDSEIVTDQNEIAKAKSGADWVCSYCASHNKVYDVVCSSCGNKRDTTAGDESLPITERRYDKKPPIVDSKSKRTAPAGDGKSKKRMGCIKKGLIGLAIFIVGFIVLMELSSEVTVKVNSHNWSTEIEYEEYMQVEESDWTLPPKATLISKSKEVHHYNSVPDGYETKTRTVREKVGEERVKVGERDLGNGHFEDIYENQPIYEERTEEYEEKKYRKVPVYQTKYKYTIFRWIKQQPLNNQGQGINPQWHAKEPELANTEKYQVKKRTTKYFLKIIGDDGKEQSEEVSEAFWKATADGAELKAEKAVVGGDYSQLETLNK